MLLGDAAYGSEENNTWLEKHQIGNFLKFNCFHQEQYPPRKLESLEKQRFVSANFPYDSQKDEFTCPAGHPMLYMETRKHHTENGYLTERRYYESAHCEGCSPKQHGTKAKGNQRIQVSFKLKADQQQAKANLLSDQGIALRKKRSTDVETAFGDINHNMRFRRFMLRGLNNVEIEWGLFSIAHNTRKLAVIRSPVFFIFFIFYQIGLFSAVLNQLSGQPHL